MACKPKLESLITVLNPDGTINKPIMNDEGSLVWAWIYPSSTIKYRVKTLGDGYNGKSDEFTFAIVRQDFNYLKQLTDRVFDNASDEKRVIYEQEILAVLNNESNSLPAFGKDTAEATDLDRVLATVTSKVHTTDDDGVYEGSYTLPSNAQTGQYAFIVQYGYDEDARGGDADRAWTAWEALLVAWIAVMAVFLIYYAVGFIVWAGTGGLTSLGAGAVSGATGVAGFVTVKVAEAAAIGAVMGFVLVGGAMAVDYAIIAYIDNMVEATPKFMNMVAGLRKMPSVGANKYGCEFTNVEGNPEAIMHLYGVGVAPHFEFNEDGELVDDKKIDWGDPKIIGSLAMVLGAVVVMKRAKSGVE